MAALVKPPLRHEQFGFHGPDPGHQPVQGYQVLPFVTFSLGNAIAIEAKLLTHHGIAKFAIQLDLTPSVRIEQIGHLFTDSGLRAEWVARLRQAGIAFTICSDGRDQEDRIEESHRRWTMDDGR